MTDRFNADILLDYAVSDDGRQATLVLGDAVSPPLTLTVSPDLLEGLMLTLPLILLELRRRREQDSSLSLPYALERLDISLARDQMTRILTLTTPGEFSVSFRMSEEQLADMRRKDAALEDQLRRSLQ